MRVGIAGIGFMGWIHWLAWQTVPGVEITALFSQEPERRAGDWTAIRGNFGPPGERVDLSEIKVHDSLESLFNDDNVDLFDLCLPPGVHASATIAALASGRDVFCEKPMALRLEQCDAMLAAQQMGGKHLLIGHVLPFFPEYAFARKAIADKTYGKFLGGNFQRTISDPTWIRGFFDPEICGGPLLDLLIHDVHFIRTVLGMPLEVDAVGRLNNGLVEYMTAAFRFGDTGQVATCRGGVVHQSGRPFSHGFEMHFEDATMQFEFAAFDDGPELMPLKVLTRDGRILRPDLGDADPVRSFEAELAEVNRVVTGVIDRSDVLDGRLARDAIQIVEALSQSVRTGKPVSFDA